MRQRVVAFDLRGLGRSSRPEPNDYSLDAMADDLAAVIDFAAAPCVVLGHNGSMIALMYATIALSPLV